ncbi:hypothetical protein SCHPADRAFT_902256 [Schizopora paradoxa]|uniref:Uncharacterized protein n=1 Tax=Schizopora paradoxa TaxID=27342 RepID=A0A0H2RVI2_9AGAM|nr:hypothetical protein SCHPADRAFT_902256 [Schizopora paradoxa]
MPGRTSSKRVDVPPQVLDHIFRHRERVFFKHRYSPESRLYPLLFVCKEWHDIAERRLYASVSLGDEKTVVDEDGEEYEIDGEEVCEMFYETVRKNPRLASLVRELRLGTLNHARKETEHHIALLKICKNVEHVEFSGYNGYLLEELKAVLGAKENLVSLMLSRYGLADKEGDCFFSTSDLFLYMLKWPHLERIYLHNHTLAYYDDDDGALPAPTSVAGRNPALKEVTVREDSLTPEYLELLSKMAPGIRHLEIHIHASSILALQSSLQTWSPTLAHLNLTVRGEPKNSLAPVCSGLTELRYLNVESGVIPPSEFVHFKSLEALMYFATSKDAEELARVIQKKGSLPSLRKVTCDHTKGKLSSESVKKLREVCKARKIEFCDSFLTEEESSYYGDSDKEDRYAYAAYARPTSEEDEEDFVSDEYDEDEDEEDEDEEEEEDSSEDD